MADDDALWMPLYIGDYLKDTMKLTTEQHGAYLLLLMALWQDGGSLEDNDEDLAAVCKLPVIMWKKHKPKLMKYFLVEGGMVQQKRLTTEFEKAERIIRANRENGKKGGRPKKNNPNITQLGTQNKPTGLDSVSENECFTKPKHNPNPNPDETQSQSQSHNPPSSSVVNDDGSTPNQGGIVVADWLISDEILLGLEIDHGIPVEFSLAVLDEFRDYWAGKAMLLPTEWQSRFRQRVRDQHQRTNLRSVS